MTRHGRRKFLKSGLASAAVTSSASLRANMLRVSKPHVVVIGGGAGGATAAGLIARDGDGEVDVTLVEANKTYHSCFFSNLYLGGVRSFESLGHQYDRLKSQTSLSVVHGKAIHIDREAKNVELESGFIRYDLLVLAPGIDFIEGSVNGWQLENQHLMPHAYKGGEQVRLLRAQIESIPQGGVFAIVPPSGEYRCPPGPYERVCMAAHLLKKTNPTAKIIIADPKPVFSKMGLFREAWKKYYKGMVDMNSDVDMSDFRVDPKAMTIRLEGETIKVDACNVIPGQKAGKIAELAGIVKDNWAPVHAQNMLSRLDESIYVLGDAAAQGDMPKSAFSASSQARVCANAVLGRLIDTRVFPAKFFNTCWSLLAENDGVKIGASYQAASDKIERVDGFVSRRREDEALRKKTYEESLGWYSSITAGMFGN